MERGRVLYRVQWSEGGFYTEYNGAREGFIQSTMERGRVLYRVQWSEGEFYTEYSGAREGFIQDQSETPTKPHEMSLYRFQALPCLT